MVFQQPGSRAPVLLAPAYVLHRRPYRDTSLLLECFSRDYGRVGIVARGGRGRLAGVLQPFAPLLLSWSGAGELKTLTHAEPDGYVDPPRGAALGAGFYLNELLLRACGRLDAHPGVYHAYHRTLPVLTAGTGAEAALRYFERDLLAELGYGLQLEHDANGVAIDPARHYHYLPERGAIAAEDGSLPGTALQALRTGALVEPEHLAAGKHLLRAQISWHFGDRPLKSREFYYALAGRPARPAPD